MSEFEKTIKDAIEPKDTKKSYGEVMRERRAKLNELSAKAYSDIACDRKAFVAMLDTASRFLRNSVGNIMLIYAQNPKATELRTYDEWKQKEKIVKKGATQVYVLKKKEYTDSEGKARVGYDPEGKFDVLDTVDGQAAPAPKYDEKTLVRGLVHACPAKVVVDADFPQSNPEGAAYIKDKNEIRCKYGMPLDELVPTVLNAAALANFCGGDETSRVADYEFKARCIAYLLTEKYGISTDNIQIQSIPSAYESMDADEFKGEVADLLTTAKAIDGRVAEVLFRPKEQNKSTDTKAHDSVEKGTAGKEER